MTGKPISIGIIGGGMMAQVGHIPFLLENPQCGVKTIAESRPSLAEYIRRTYGFGNVIADHRDILNDPGIDAVILSAPRPATGNITLECLEAGKHILAEKPMAHSARQAQRLVDAAQKNNLLYGVGFMKRHDPGIIAVKSAFRDLLQTERAGKLLYANFYNHSKSYAHPVPPHQRPLESRSLRFESWPLYPDWMPEEQRNRFAWFMNSASHDINLIHYFFEETPDVLTSAISSNDSVSSTMALQDTLVTLTISRAETGTWTEGAEFVFEKGRLSYKIPSPMDMDGVTRAVLEENADDRSKSLELETEKGWSFQRQIENFIGALAGGVYTGTTGAQGLKDMELIEKIWRKGLGRENHE